MSQMKNDKQMKVSDVDFKYSDNALCCKCYDDKSVLRLASNIEGKDIVTTVQDIIKVSHKIHQ